MNKMGHWLPLSEEFSDISQVRVKTGLRCGGMFVDYDKCTAVSG